MISSILSYFYFNDKTHLQKTMYSFTGYEIHWINGYLVKKTIGFFSVPLNFFLYCELYFKAVPELFQYVQNVNYLTR